MKRLKLLIGLSASVRIEGNSFAPLEAQHDIPLLAESRWRGLAAAIHLGFAEKLLMLGGLEKLPSARVPISISAKLNAKADADGFTLVPRGLATIHGLMHNYGVAAHQLGYEVTAGNTGGNVAAINRVLEESGLAPEQVGVTTNLYHLPRAFMDLHQAGFQAVVPVPAEAFWLAATAKDSSEREMQRQQLLREFGESQLSHRVVMELNGAADKLLDSYQALSS